MGAEHKAIVIGASAGAVEALTALLPSLRPGFRLPVIVVVHLPADRRSAMAELFRAKCTLEVREAEDKDPIAAGTIYFAPPDYHLLVEADRTLSLSCDAPVLFSRPSIDVLFESAADAYGPQLVGVVLTGANADGARGLKAIIDEGGIGIVQTPSSAFASAMPEAALQASPTAKPLTLQAIAAYLEDI
ncbi:MAG TPA: chemotaxis protein CheB [Devosia sp.]|jgi:two-component system chemotaxis response regulator CheB|uniref:chemotaxis protein CheB n=1 Tax=Devosia sp. TaxID=1871048 RepID=UPI002DDD7193|nr:chemotaxis protein CheB [Devosia sp.]HEV2516618.1 chemotaxis protein CheB [Devosia sp.]